MNLLYSYSLYPWIVQFTSQLYLAFCILPLYTGTTVSLVNNPIFTVFLLHNGYLSS